MLSNNINIENTILLKELCNKINYYYNKKTLENDNITLYNTISTYVNNLDKNYKNTIFEEYSNKCFNKHILYKINNKFDGEPLTIICYNIIAN